MTLNSKESSINHVDMEREREGVNGQSGSKTVTYKKCYKIFFYLRNMS